MRAFLAILFLLTSSVQAALTPVIVNGSLEGLVAGATPPPGWHNVGEDSDTVNADGPFNNTGVPWTLSPDGGTFSRQNGPDDFAFNEAIEQVVGGFEPGVSYTLNFWVTNLGFYFSLTDEWRDRAGNFEILIDGAYHERSTIYAPATRTDPIVWTQQSVTFIASAETQTIQFRPHPLGGGSHPAYLGIDGISIASEACFNGVDDDGDGLIDIDDEDCQGPPGGQIEICTNGIDDDGDGFIDNDDLDCQIDPGFTDINVRCLHEPLYPQPGDPVTISAQAINSEGDAVAVQAVGIYIDEDPGPAEQVQGIASTSHTFTPTGSYFSYGCRAINGPEEVTSWSGLDDIRRGVAIGDLNNSAFNAVPVGISGLVQSKIDLVFFPDNDEYTGFTDPAFLADVRTLIWDGYFTIPWFVEHQSDFNFWIGMSDEANASPAPVGELCLRVKPDDFDADYSWADAAAIVHTSVCRDNAGGGAFTVEMDPTRLQVVAHETGHTPFGLSDEYPGKAKGYFEASYHPNVFDRLEDCHEQALDRSYEPTDCRLLEIDENGNQWWIPEPDYAAVSPQIDQTKDLMQQTGGVETPPDGIVVDRYKVGVSERDRMGWYSVQCYFGDC